MDSDDHHVEFGNEKVEEELTHLKREFTCLNVGMGMCIQKHNGQAKHYESHINSKQTV